MSKQKTQQHVASMIYVQCMNHMYIERRHNPPFRWKRIIQILDSSWNSSNSAGVDHFIFRTMMILIRTQQLCMHSNYIIKNPTKNGIVTAANNNMIQMYQRRRWELQENPQQSFSIKYFWETTTTSDCMKLRRTNSLSLLYNTTTTNASAIVTRRRHIGTTTIVQRINNSNHPYPHGDRQKVPILPLQQQRQQHSTNSRSTSSISSMGIFRLLNDTQRTILIEQQQFTAHVVRTRILI